MFVRSCSYDYILRASTVRRLNTEDWATSANFSTRNSDQAKNLRTKLENRTTTLIHVSVWCDVTFLTRKVHENAVGSANNCVRVQIHIHHALDH